MAVPVSVVRALWYGSGVIVALFAFVAGTAFGQDADAAFQIKAAFVQKFATYVSGPGFEGANGALVFGVAGSAPVYEFLTQLTSAQADGSRPVEVRRVATVDDLNGVNVLFVGDGAAADAPALLQRGVAGSMLTITDVAGPQPPNSMIHFFIADDRVRFDIALAPTEAAGLRLSSRLLQVARQVMDE
jgi:hypothetical protein